MLTDELRLENSSFDFNVVTQAAHYTCPWLILHLLETLLEVSGNSSTEIGNDYHGQKTEMVWAQACVDG